MQSDTMPIRLSLLRNRKRKGNQIFTNNSTGALLRPSKGQKHNHQLLPKVLNCIEVAIVCDSLKVLGMLLLLL